MPVRQYILCTDEQLALPTVRIIGILEYTVWTGNEALLKFRPFIIFLQDILISKNV